MRERITEWMHLLPEGTGGTLLLLVQLVVALTLVGWAYNRGFRPVERGPIIRLLLLIPAFGLALLVRHIHSEVWQPVLIAVAVIIAGFFGRTGNGRSMGVPMMMIAALLGLNLMLSAIVLTAVAVLVYLLSPVKKR
ncbi:MAG TPA: hypothetical protein PLV70_09990 [Flavobacteriales bacterium]|nr:hypothetical protein [Flavobacteriales bacterium]HRN37825.1 hypothetical protein [Flavobacteriales bacterium]HRO39053.1 hypothetical protein [Flavobacteriales bacterium]HRP82460.1 hypothetical protein [Flavobacteriales bacterium]HRQ85430.1 hypothetical protein [Flavobacteriales bacterium]